MSQLTTEAAQAIVASVLSGPRTDATRCVAAVVVDAGGHVLSMAREVDAPPLLGHVAEAKAQSCIVYGKPTKSIMEWAEATPTWFAGVSRVAQSRTGLALIGSLGGVLIVDADGKRIGAVGVAGEAGEMDEQLAVAGIDAAGLAAYAG